MSIFKDFNDFAIKGNMADLAIGVIIGGAFGKIVSSLVDDVTMPLLNPLMPKGQWRDWVIGPGVKVGSLLGTMVNFFIVAVVMFGVVSLLHGRRKKHEEKKSAGEELDNTDRLLTDIRDEMRGLRGELGGPAVGHRAGAARGDVDPPDQP